MTERTGWEEQSSNLLKAEIKRRGLSYDDLRIALEKVGIKKSTPNLNKTINSGKFAFSFFLQCVSAIGIKTLRFDELIVSENE